MPRKLEPVGNLASCEIFATCENASCILILAPFNFQFTHFLHFTILPFMYKWVLRIFLYFFLVIEHYIRSKKILYRGEGGGGNWGDFLAVIKF